MIGPNREAIRKIPHKHNIILAKTAELGGMKIYGLQAMYLNMCKEDRKGLIKDLIRENNEFNKLDTPEEQK